MLSFLCSINKLGLRLGSWSLLILLGLLVSVGITVAAGPGGADVEIPLSAVVSGGANLTTTLPNGDILDVDLTVGDPIAGEGAGSDGHSLACGFQALREAVEESSGPIGTPFRRGDTNTDGQFNIADGIATLGFLFSGGTITCLDAADSNDDGQVNIADGIKILGVLFSGDTPPVTPGPDSCGLDPTDDVLECETYDAC